MTRITRRRTGMTLLELITALTLFSILSLAGYVLISGTMNTDRYLRTANTAESEIELAIRRITYNLRAASSMATPSTTTASNTLTIATQPDAGNGNTSYTVTYKVVSGQLIESDGRYAAGKTDHVICNNVGNFTVQNTQLTGPRMITVTLQLTGAQPVQRVFQVACRNL